MNPFDVLSLSAELSLGLAGFAGIVVLLGGGPGRWSPVDLLRIRLLLISVLAVLFASVVPLGLAASGVSLESSLRLGCLVMFGFVGRWFYASRPIPELLRRDPEVRQLLDPRLRIVYSAAAGVALVSQLAGLASSLVDLAPFPFLFLGILWGLFSGALGFLRLLFARPDQRET